MPKPNPMTPDVRQEILKRMASGQSVREICRDEAMPASSTIYATLAEDPAFAEQYARACEARAHLYADEIIDISDDASNDWIERKSQDGSSVEVVNHEHIARSKLRVDSRKWLMSKMLPKKYGDRLTTEVSGPGGGPIETVNWADNSLAEKRDIARRLAFLLSGGLRAASDLETRRTEPEG